MNYQVIINPELGGKDTGSSNGNEYEKNYNLKFAKLLNNKLNDIGVNSVLVRNSDITMSDSDRIKYINSIINNKSIILTNGLGSSNIEIVYGLNSNDNLSSRLYNNFEDNNYSVDKYYQRRDSKNTNLDYDSIIRNFPNNESIIIRYGNINNNSVNTNISNLVDITANTLKSYLGLSNDTYIVKSGDNLYSIARKFNTNVDDLKKLNNLTNNTLSIGQKLVIKSIPNTIGNNTSNKYIVKNGDTLYSIARKYNISVDKLKKYNNLLNNIINIGQVLNIPDNNIEEYIVKKGDTLYSISKKYNVDIKDIMNLNNLSSSLLSINQKLVIPK